MPVHIPNLIDTYYQDALRILKVVIVQVLNTVDLEKTAVTIINNCSCEEVDAYLMSLERIEKYIRHNSNKGKVLPILNEVRGINEPYVTLMDADVVLSAGWEEEVFKIFKKTHKAGVVAPLPCQSLSFYYNQSAFVDLYLRKNLEYSKVVDDTDSKSFTTGLGNESLHNRSNRAYNWAQKQYHFKNDESILLGSGHFVATYKSFLFKNATDFPVEVFENGLEEIYIDQKSAQMDLYRLSTVKSYAYHMGNVYEELYLKKSELNKFSIPKVRLIKKTWWLELKIGSKTLLFRVLKKIHRW